MNMSAPIVTSEMFAILRNALGLGVFQKRPTRNNVVLEGRGGSADPSVVEQMIDMELLTRRIVYGPGGEESHILVSDEGTRLAVDEQRRYHELAAEVQAEHKRQHDQEFGLNKKHPFVPSSRRIHDEVLRRMAEIEAD